MERGGRNRKERGRVYSVVFFNNPGITRNGCGWEEWEDECVLMCVARTVGESYQGRRKGEEMERRRWEGPKVIYQTRLALEFWGFLGLTLWRLW